MAMTHGSIDTELDAAVRLTLETVQQRNISMSFQIVPVNRDQVMRQAISAKPDQVFIAVDCMSYLCPHDCGLAVEYMKYGAAIIISNERDLPSAGTHVAYLQGIKTTWTEELFRRYGLKFQWIENYMRTLGVWIRDH